MTEDVEARVVEPAPEPEAPGSGEASGPSPPRAAPVAAAAPAVPRRRMLSRFRQWLLRSEALRQARTLGNLSVEQAELSRRARLAMELGDRALFPVEPFRHGSAHAHAIDLYRQSVAWSLQVRALGTAEGEPVSPRQHVIARVAGDAVLASHVQQILEETFEETAGHSNEKLERDAVVLRAFALALLEQVDQRRTLTLRFERQRFSRLTLLALVCAGIATGAYFTQYWWTHRGDLAAGRPIQLSSTYPNFNPGLHVVDGNATRILFHTAEELGPWAEVDLGRVVTISRVEVTNRKDCCSERANPMTIKVSRDGQVYTLVGRREGPFSVYTARFAPTEARFVRLTVEKRTWLHLERISVFAR